MDAQFETGMLYFQGLGVKKNSKLAFDYFEKSATGGHEEAQSYVLVMYCNGIGVEKDILKALYWDLLHKRTHGRTPDEMKKWLDKTPDEMEKGLGETPDEMEKWLGEKMKKWLD